MNNADNTVAKMILAQLGGNKFLAMTGASQLMSMSDGLQFCLPRGAYKVVITLTSDDTYMIRGYGKLSRKTYEMPIKFVVPCDASSLCEAFTNATGLDVCL